MEEVRVEEDEVSRLDVDAEAKVGEAEAKAFIIALQHAEGAQAVVEVAGVRVLRRAELFVDSERAEDSVSDADDVGDGGVLSLPMLRAELFIQNVRVFDEWKDISPISRIIICEGRFAALLLDRGAKVVKVA